MMDTKMTGEIHHIFQLLFSNLRTILPILGITYAIYFIASTVYDVYFGPLSKIPGPKLWAASYIPLAYIIFTGQDAVAKTALHKRYGPAVRISPDELSFNSGQAWKTIYGHRIGAAKKSFPKDPNFYITSPNGARHVLTAIPDEDHTRQRRILTHSFSDRSLKEQEPLLKEWSHKLVRKLREVGQDTPVNIVSYYNFTTFDVMADLTFAEPLNMLEGSGYVPWVKVIFDNIKTGSRLALMRKHPILRIIPRLLGNLARKKQVEHLNYAAVRVDRRLANPPSKPNIWTEVLKRGGKDGNLTLGEMHANSSIFMLAGTETTATLLSGLTYYLLRNPVTMALLVEELRSAFKDEDSITVETLAALPYLNACIEEGLRMYPPVPTGLPRKTPEGGALIGDHWIPEGITTAVTQFAAYRSEDNWYQPYKFLPERWLGKDERFANDDHTCFQPFLTGPRNCIGRNLAYHEARVLLCEVLWNFDLELTKESENWAQQEMYTLWEKPALMVKLKPVAR